MKIASHRIQSSRPHFHGLPPTIYVMTFTFWLNNSGYVSPSSLQPLIAMSGDEVVVVEMRVGAMDAIDFSKLARTERFLFIKAP